MKAGVAAHGTATAASILNTGVVGAAVGFGYYDIGFVLALANFLVLYVLGRMKRQALMGEAPKRQPAEE